MRCSGPFLHCPVCGSGKLAKRGVSMEQHFDGEITMSLYLGCEDCPREFRLTFQREGGSKTSSFWESVNDPDAD